jgi:hypothetical protein
MMRMDRRSGSRLTDLIEVKGEFAGNGAVQTRLQERCPVLVQDVLSARVTL